MVSKLTDRPTVASNHSKADQDPAAWQPRAVGYRCTYTTDYVAMQPRCHLAIDGAAQAALSSSQAAVRRAPIVVIRAR